MEVTRHWRLREQRYALTGSTCTQCGKAFFAPRPVCNNCQSASDNSYEFESHRIHRQTMVAAPAHR